MGRYDHAAELMNTTPPLVKLDFLMRDLRAWAVKNPPLRPLHAEFVTAVRQLHDLSGPPVTGPALLEQAAAVIADTGRDGQEAAKTLRLHAAYLREAQGSPS
jgi:hypothetical protein